MNISSFLQEAKTAFLENIEKDPDDPNSILFTSVWNEKIGLFCEKEFKEIYINSDLNITLEQAMNLFMFYINEISDELIDKLYKAKTGSVNTYKRVFAKALEELSDKAVHRLAVCLKVKIVDEYDRFENNCYTYKKILLYDHLYLILECYQALRSAVFTELITNVVKNDDKIFKLCLALQAKDKSYLERSVFDEMISFLTLAYPMRDEIVPCLVGPPGIGKTAAVHEHAKRVGAKNVVTIIASQILPNEVSGITMPDPDTKAMEIYDHFKLGHLEDGDIVFFDELLEADQCVLSACLTLIESRMLMSGKKLPSIQIIAATNPTIQPASLRLNIRQRFLFKKFDIDKSGTALYIERETGLKLNDSIINMLNDEGTDYNVLTPRSLTKLAKWVAATPGDRLEELQEVINSMWNNDLGTKLIKCRPNDKQKNEFIIKEKIKEIAYDVCDDNKTQSELNHFFDSDDFEEGDFKKIIEKLSAIIDWEEIAKQLDNIEL